MKILERFGLLAVLFISMASAAEAQVEVRGVVGETVTPRTIKVRELPKITKPYVGPVREKPIGQPPPVERVPPPDASRLRNVTIDKSAALEEITPLAPTLGVNFEGITQGRYIPSEPQPAAGPVNIFSIGNTSVTITNKDGSGRVEYGINVFFGIPVAEDSAFDSKCYYDALRGRFIVLTETQGKVGNTQWSYYYLAVSKTSDASGDWWVYKFDQTKDGTTSTNNWSDFPGLGVSEDKIVMSSQQFKFGGNIFQYQKLRVVDRARVYSGLSVAYIDFANFPNQVFVTKPGRNISRDSTIYLLATRYAGGSNVVYGKITGSPSSPTLTFGTTIPVQTYGSVVNAKGGSNTATVNAGDARTPDFVIRNGFLHIAWHFGIDFSGTTYDAIRYLKLNIQNNPPTVVTDETFAANGIYYYYPMCTVDSVGTMFIGFGRSSATEYPSSYVSGKRRSDASIQPSVLAKAGDTLTAQSRWGDFTGIDMDETASSPTGSFSWYAGQWTKASNRFGTWITQMSFSYGAIAGQVLVDADEDSTTTGDRSGLSGWTVTLKKGSTTLGTTSTDVSGNYSFGYLETDTFNIVLTKQSAYNILQVVPGSGGTSQTRVDSVTIQAIVTNSQSSSGNTFVLTTQQNILASVKVFLEGAYDSTAGAMRTDLKTGGILASHFSGVPIPSQAVDSITVEIRNALSAAASTVRVLRPAWLLSNGTIRSFSDTTKSYVGYPAAPGSYYVVVSHRNHLPVESAATVSLGLSPPGSPYDFTVGQSQAHGANPMRRVGSVYAMVAGDASGNGQVQNTDVNFFVRAQMGQSGYLSGDANLDGQVDSDDLNFFLRPNLGLGSQVP
jgi:hypothetical protein